MAILFVPIIQTQDFVVFMVHWPQNLKQEEQI